MSSPILPASPAALDFMPDFFIAGAMKCGTTTLHHMLAQHPQVFIPRTELFFFDIDDFEQHADFFPFLRGAWRDRDFDAELPQLLEWYRRFFEPARPGQLRGEDSTTYLASAKAPARIARLRPQAKILIMLRDPAERCYSEYWHLVRHGRALMSFEDSLRYWPHMLVQRSFYQRQLARLDESFPREQVKVMLLEDLVRKPSQVLGDVLRFLGMSEDSLPAAALKQHSNAGGAPRFPGLQLWRNRLLWRVETKAILKHLPGNSVPLSPWAAQTLRLANRLHRRINPLLRQPPPMQVATRRFLNRYFQRENAGLDERLGRCLRDIWYHDS